jgi:hypothetical protein
MNKTLFAYGNTEIIRKMIHEVVKEYSTRTIRSQYDRVVFFSDEWGIPPMQKVMKDGITNGEIRIYKNKSKVTAFWIKGNMLSRKEIQLKDVDKDILTNFLNIGNTGKCVREKQDITDKIIKIFQCNPSDNLLEKHGSKGIDRANALKNNIDKANDLLEILNILYKHLHRKESHTMLFWRENHGNLFDESLDTLLLKAIYKCPGLCDYLSTSDQQVETKDLESKDSREAFRTVVILSLQTQIMKLEEQQFILLSSSESKEQQNNLKTN